MQNNYESIKSITVVQFCDVIAKNIIKVFYGNVTFIKFPIVFRVIMLGVNNRR